MTLKENPTHGFERKGLRKLKYFVGINVVYFRKGIFVSKEKFVLDRLEEIVKLGCRILRVPIEQNQRMENEKFYLLKSLTIKNWSAKGLTYLTLDQTLPLLKYN